MRNGNDISQKRTCNGCRAIADIYPNSWSCSLGYEVKSIPLPDFPKITKPVPCEPCPKPLTYDAWIKAYQQMRKLKGG